MKKGESMKRLTLGSLFDGSGGFPLGGVMAGIDAVWASEIEPFPIRVTTKRFPKMKHYGDVSAMDGAKIEPVDIITFGSPCQDMSLAGRRAGLAGGRSCLFYQAVRIIKEMREATNGKYPTFAVWENVFGAFNSNGGEDFRAVLEAMCQISDSGISIPRPPRGVWDTSGCIMADGYSIAWRCLDAQYWGVPQRRRRVYLVADFGGQRAGKILFESEMLSRYPEKGGRAWQISPAGTERSAGETGGWGGKAFHLNVRDEYIDLHDTAGALMTRRTEQMQTYVAEPTRVKEVYENHIDDARYNGPLDTAPTVISRYGTGGNNQPLVVDRDAPVYGISKETWQKGIDGRRGGTINENLSPTLESVAPCAVSYKEVYSLQGSMLGRKDGNGPQGKGVDKDVSFTLDTVDRHAVVYGLGYDALNQGNNAKIAPTINEDVHPPRVADGPGGVAYGFTKETCQQSENGKFYEAWTKETSPTLRATGPAGVGMLSVVRRLTPTECARLQGFPDWWCSDLETSDPTGEELDFWRKVFDTHRAVINPSEVVKSTAQIRKWLAHPYSEAAEYKMWGNGVALPCVYFVMCGIVWAAALDENEGD